MRALLLILVVLAGVPGMSQADVVQQTDALNWLKKAAAAAHQLNYSGTYIYQHGDHVETSRIAHLRNESGEHEKLEALDGSPREVIRNNDEVLCFKPDSNASVVVERRKLERSFPALLPRQLGGITENYRAQLSDSGRAADHACQVIILEPKDQYRYRHELWIDRATGLLLKASMLNEKNEVISQFAFTQIAIGGPIASDLIKPKISGRKVVISSEPAIATELQQNDRTWVVKQPPPGFTQVTVMKRMMPGKDVPVKHLVFSDGLAAVSVFVEPVAAGAEPVLGAARHGAFQIYMRTIDDHKIIVLGEVPAITVKKIADSVSRN
ncbi:MAG TPA: MucB/RseB C-terminal domain-containing protein [Sulfuricella sp.]|nr:MucB/RseB C-terminal domain-containing protein [Sulfuricella sp.]